MWIGFGKGFMALQGKFIIDNASLSPLSISGVGTFMAFSGNGPYRNRGGCTGVVGQGPIPAGRYWIVDRPAGGLRSRMETWVRDTWNNHSGAPSNHSEWFALYCDDGRIDDYTWVNGVERGNFRLHPASGEGRSLGCITLPSHADFQTIRKALLHTQRISVRNSGLKAYGWIEVIAYGNSCP